MVTERHDHGPARVHGPVTDVDRTTSIANAVLAHDGLIAIDPDPVRDHVEQLLGSGHLELAASHTASRDPRRLE